MEHPRLQVAAAFGGGNIAGVEVDGVSADAGKTLANPSAPGLARRSASREPTSTIRNGNPTEATSGGWRSVFTSAADSERQAAACAALTCDVS